MYHESREKQPTLPKFIHKGRSGLQMVRFTDRRYKIFLKITVTKPEAGGVVCMGACEEPPQPGITGYMGVKSHPYHIPTQVVFYGSK
jgi:hypothetical protein